MLGYLREYWGGFFPLLLVEVQEGGEGGAPLDPREVRAGWPSFIVCHHGEIQTQTRRVSPRANSTPCQTRTLKLHLF